MFFIDIFFEKIENKVLKIEKTSNTKCIGGLSLNLQFMYFVFVNPCFTLINVFIYT